MAGQGFTTMKNYGFGARKANRLLATKSKRFVGVDIGQPAVDTVDVDGIRAFAK